MAWPFGSSEKSGEGPSDLSEERLRYVKHSDRASSYA